MRCERVDMGREVNGGGVLCMGWAYYMAQFLSESEVICIACRCNSQIHLQAYLNKWRRDHRSKDMPRR